ncbi:hypothetical protein [Halobacillus yeomjeoni]|nr:hypothetical protein [Halobacillus yeomjeoni]
MLTLIMAFVRMASGRTVPSNHRVLFSGSFLGVLLLIIYVLTV